MSEILIDSARARYLEGRIDVEEFERQIERALKGIGPSVRQRRYRVLESGDVELLPTSKH